MKRSLKSNIQKPLWPWILFNFFDLNRSIQVLEQNPNAKTLDIAQQFPLQTCKISPKSKN